MTAKLKPTLAKLIDELGDLHEKIAQLKPRLEELKDIIKSNGPGVFDGKVFTVMNEAAKTTNYKTELLKLNVDEETLEKCKVVTAYLRVKVQRRTPIRLVKST